MSGYTVVADKLNFFRFTSHFRSVHRGQFFTTMKTTTVRKLLPESWGFLCPIHTPDGGPCGLLNHISAPASVVALPLSEAAYSARCAAAAASAAVKGSGGEEEEEEEDGSGGGSGGAVLPPASVFEGLTALLVALGMTPHSALGTLLPASQLPVLVDGVPVGGAAPHLAAAIARALRLGKALAGGVAGGVERMGEGELAGQREAVAGLVRAAVGGLFGGAAGAGGEAGHKRRGGARPAQQTAAALPALGALGVLPASLEVALIPPPWWDAAVDPALEPDSRAAEERALAWGFPGAAAGGGGGSVGGGGEGGAGGAVPERLTGLFPGLFLHTVPHRPVRPVLQLDTGLVELVSPLEQLFMEIAATPEDGVDIAPHYTHAELSPMAMLSEIASLTPFSDMNQSPRNMYQCQMCKQTIGTPAHALKYRTDSKLHRILHPQVPLVQNAAQGVLGLDEYPNGANACVAVLAYTGYDMEDACIINKAAFERGWGWAAVYKTYDVDMAEGRPATDAGRFLLHNEYLSGEGAPEGGASVPRGKGAGGAGAPLPPVPGHPVWETLDGDGLPPIGAFIAQGAPFYATLDSVEGKHKVTLFKEAEGGYVEEVRLLPPSTAAGDGRPGLQRASIKMRFDRRPVVGDKFSSRHGQKGVLSFLWPAENMPFSDRGMTPDVLINPHAFPSRMTIGMLVESMAGKAGALNGAFQDATPFRFDEKNRAVDAFGEQLAAAGYNYYGTETMYSGVTGEPLGVDIFFGVVYYQRLRHMVKDKAQVRATGPVNALTRQPVKGKKKGGGVRFGEMERDALLAHGTAFLLHDRLHASSDAHTALVCKRCGSMLTTFSFPQAAAALEAPGPAAAAAGGGIAAPAATQGGTRRGPRRAPMCAACKTGDHVTVVTMPYVFRYLANELAAMNVKLKLRVGEQ